MPAFHNMSSLILWASACCVAASILLALFFSTASTSRRKARGRLLAGIWAGTGIIAASLVLAVQNWWLPLNRVDGTIAHVHVQHQRGDVRIDLSIRATSNATAPLTTAVAVYAGQANPYFRVGQQLTVAYEPESGFIRQATFLAVDGTQVSEFSESRDWFYWLMALGVGILFIGVAQYLRDPTGNEMGGAMPETQLRIFDSTESGS
jgi:hypothetical protein